ncbi:MAG: biotin/lipoyl-binding protein, partial [Holophaga sp.]|nr:biotin/lipoyl-binding protein [Holophaga sp.]
MTPPLKISPHVEKQPDKPVDKQEAAAAGTERGRKNPKALSLKTKLIGLAVLAVLAGGAGYAWTALRHRGPGPGFVSGNGRLEATEIDVAAKLAGRVQDILVNEGDLVEAGQTLAHM